MDSYKRLEESGVYIHYSPEHYKNWYCSGNYSWVGGERF